jgi:hypothetical protein
MGQPRLRVYYGPQEEHGGNTALQRRTQRCDTVTVPLGDILLLLREAMRSERNWLRDFQDDEITVSTDLYEVILAYQHYRRPSA